MDDRERAGDHRWAKVCLAYGVERRFVPLDYQCHLLSAPLGRDRTKSRRRVSGRGSTDTALSDADARSGASDLASDPPKAPDHDNVPDHDDVEMQVDPFSAPGPRHRSVTDPSRTLSPPFIRPRLTA